MITKPIIPQIYLRYFIFWPCRFEEFHALVCHLAIFFIGTIDNSVHLLRLNGINHRSFVKEPLNVLT